MNDYRGTEEPFLSTGFVRGGWLSRGERKEKREREIKEEVEEEGE